MADVNTSLSAYLLGGMDGESLVHAYLVGGSEVDDSISAFLTGDIYVDDSISAYLSGVGSASSSVYAYLFAVLRSNISAYLKGSNTGDDDVAVDYIILRSSDSSIDEKFRVIAQDYDDGTPSKAQTTQRTIGGGVAHSVGAIYRSWNPTIKVREEEPDVGYGDLQDLIDLFELNNPNGTPSNQITFIDHHNVSRVVIMPGDLRKSTLGSEIEGQEAWYIVKVNLQEMNNA